MSRFGVMLTAICLALTPATFANEPVGPESRPHATAVGGEGDRTASASRCTLPEVTVPYTEEHYWRWTAYRELDCAIEAIEQAMKKRGDSEDGTVTLTGEELEQLRARAFSARDAAARIGR